MGDAHFETLDILEHMKGKAFTVGLVSIWLLAIGSGLYALEKYENTPGKPGEPPVVWRGSDLITLSPDKATLIMLAHPQCPCTKASVAELAELMTKERERVDAYVLFLAPSSMPGWEKSALWKEAAAIPGVKVLRDVNHQEADRFASETSGQTFIYAPSGRLLFKGGITAQRGQTGENFAVSHVVAALNSESPASRSTSVFGCPLVNPK